MTRIAWIAVLGLTLWVGDCSACPMCGAAISQGQSESGATRTAHAIQSSILFMLSMPMLILSGFSGYFFYLYRKTLPRPEYSATTRSPEPESSSQLSQSFG